MDSWDGVVAFSSCKVRENTKYSSQSFDSSSGDVVSFPASHIKTRTQSWERDTSCKSLNILSS
jgi:hypothetical protein